MRSRPERRYRDIHTGAIVSVREDKPMGSDWESVAEEKKAPAKRASSNKSDK